jgi:peptidoglycan/xylan/chitin deacetylase (PgdA/CDA1 family)
MEIKQQDKKSLPRGRFLWVMALAILALVAGVWQYHSVIVEVSDGAARDIYKGVLHPFEKKSDLARHSLRVALIKSEYTAATFGENRENYYGLIKIWERLLTHEGFGYHTLTDIPRGQDIENYNLLVLPSTTCVSAEQRQAVKAFLEAGKGVVMTWACGTRNEYGQWERYSLLHEICGMDVVGPPPASQKNLSTVMLSGGYPITADLYPGFRLSVTRFDQPLSCHVREDRVMIDGVWTDVEEPSFELHSVRDRAAVTHGSYLGGRFVWMGFSVGSCRETPVQRNAFFGLIRNSMVWAGHQVQAFRPVWPDEKQCVVSITQNIQGPDDVDPRLIALLRKHRIPTTSFIDPEAMKDSPERVALLASVGEVGVLGRPSSDYQGLSLAEQQKALTADRRAVKLLSGKVPTGFRPAPGQAFSEHTLDALVRSGYRYISTSDYDRMVPNAVRSHRKVPLVTRPSVLWVLPEMPHIPRDRSPVTSDNTMLAHFAQIHALNGYYCFSFSPSKQEGGFVDRLETLFEMIKKENVLVATTHGVTEVWRGWGHVMMTTEHMSSSRTSLKVSNTGTKKVDDIVMYIELPRVINKLDIESMTLGTELPDSMSHDGIRWKLYLDNLSAGKNVTYYLDLPKNDRKASPDESSDVVPMETAEADSI